MTTQYTDRVIEGMQSLYGKGFLSPGGPDEMAVFLDGIDLGGCHVLDMGCGIGGASLMLAGEFGAARVTGVDIAADLVERAQAAAEAASLADKTTFQPIEPGPFPFADASFDAVFIKDVVCHIEDKHAVFAEVARVLKPGGRLLCADFADGETRDERARLYDDWIAAMQVYGLSFHFEKLGTYTSACEAAGLEDISVRDHTRLSAHAAEREMTFVTGPDAGPLREALGEEKFAARIAASTTRFKALGSGALHHVHMFATKI
ncbi:MAG: methyltransferase domain-containing protein [Rhodospirillales bacterium]|nr:methyltransferase domain-containing protein [Rhodospirillales bacterium]